MHQATVARLETDVDDKGECHTDARLSGKTVILTGASRGFGKYLAEALRKEGANLLLVVRDKASVSGLAEKLLEIDDNKGLATCEIDLAKDPFPDISLYQAIRHVTKDGVDGLVNNAAIQGPVGPFVQEGWSVYNFGHWERTIRVDLLAPVLLCGVVVPLMLKHGHGKIINLSGGGATSARPNYSAYATAKTGLVRFSECLAAELAGTGIDVNCVSPGKMPTDMLPEGETADEDAMQKAAELVVWLLSDESNGITGKLIAAQWDDYRSLLEYAPKDKYTLRRITE